MCFAEILEGLAGFMVIIGLTQKYTMKVRRFFAFKHKNPVVRSERWLNGPERKIGLVG